MEQKYISAQEVREKYKISTTALWRAVVDKKISKFKRRGKAFFLVEEVDALWGAEPRLVSQKEEKNEN
jgi:hypothetical protein